MKEERLIKQCIKGDRQAQRLLYDLYSPKLYTLCRRYANDGFEAQDFLQEGFIIIYKKLYTFKGNGALGNWMRRVVVNVCLNQLNIKKRKASFSEFTEVNEPIDYNEAYSKMGVEEIMKRINALPPGYRTVFNLYVIDGFKHSEIAEMLNIGETTSRSQLTKARRMLQRSMTNIKRIMI